MQGLIILHRRDTIGISYRYGSIEVLERAGVHKFAGLEPGSSASGGMIIPVQHDARQGKSGR